MTGGIKLGKLIVIESGTDSSGKATQSRLLFERLRDDYERVEKIEFPDYDSRSSALIKMYLQGEFGDRAEDVNCYAASTFYAVDRYASYLREWKGLYQRGWIIIADRYTTSNMVHQGGKLSSLEERAEYLNWLEDLEFKRFGLPAPDCVVLLDVPPGRSRKLLQEREAMKSGGERDIHEEDFKHLKEAYDNALWLAERYDWVRIECIREGELRTIENIHGEIYRRVCNRLNLKLS